MQKEVKEKLNIRFKLIVLEFAREIGSVTKARREFEVLRSNISKIKKADSIIYPNIQEGK